MRDTLRSISLGLIACALFASLDRPCIAQEGVDEAATGPFRNLAPGVMKRVDPEMRPHEGLHRHDIVELVAVDPNFEWAKDVVFTRDIWCLRYEFKPMRMIWVDIPSEGGVFERKLIWYTVYTVTNTGKVLQPQQQADGTYDYPIIDSPKPIKFMPKFVLHAEETGTEYVDQVIPVAVAAIRAREDRNRRLLNTVEMLREIGPGEAVWGVATWTDVDPKIDEFWVDVAGLTNAYRWADADGAFSPGDTPLTGRTLQTEQLRTYYYRPGDAYYQDEKEIRLGSPSRNVDWEWIYR